MRRTKKASITVEAAVIVPLILGIFVLLVNLLFYFHDKIVVEAIAHETLVICSNTEDIKKEEIEEYFLGRMGKKLLLFSGVQAKAEVKEEAISLTCKATKGRYQLQIEMKMRRTEPEEYLRKIKNMERLTEEIGEKK